MADKPTWYLYLLIAAGLVGVAIILRRPLLDRLMGLAPTQPADPDETDDRPDSGADEPYGDELRAAKDMLPSPDLIRPAEQMVADHEALAEISKALDDFDRKVSDALSRFLRNQPTVLLRLPSAVEQTGEFSRRELEALLAGAS